MNFEEYLGKKPDETPKSIADQQAQEEQNKALTEKFKPTKEELDKQAAESIAKGQEIIKAQPRRDWWDTPSYVEAVERQKKVAEESAEKAAQRAKRQRDAAVLTDVADVFSRMYAQSGSNGAWKTPELSKRSEIAEAKYEDALRNRDNVYVDYQGKLATAKLQDYLNKKKQEEANRTYRLAEQKMQKEQAQQQFNRALELKKLEQGAKKIANDAARAEKELEFKNKNYAANRASNERIANKRANAYAQGRGRSTTELEVKDGQFIEVDAKRWKTANKPAIAAVVKEAIANEVKKYAEANNKPNAIENFKKTGVVPGELARSLGVASINGVPANKLADMWRKFDLSIKHVEDNYGVERDGDGEEELVWGEEKNNSETDW